MINLRPEYAAKAIAMYLADSNGINNRYKSWDHCYLAFDKARKDLDKGLTTDYDYLALHLSNYLGSWGMYRKSFLQNRDYRTHLGAVKLLLTDPDCAKLQQLPSVQSIDKHWKIIEDLWVTRFAQEYEVVGRMGIPGRDITDTLATKILLGTCGCIPATDRFYKKGVGSFGGTQTFGLNSYSEIVRYYWENWDEISKHLSGISLVSQDDLTTLYPPMKLMDMCFWQIGSCIEEYDNRYYDNKKKTGKLFSEIKKDTDKHLALIEFLK